MRKFNYSAVKDMKWDSKMLGYVAIIHEMKGKQTLYLKQKPEGLDRLVEIAKIQSTESSNEIEGIRTTNTRLKQLVSEKTTPKNRDEQEIAGYRDALSVIHESFEYIPLTPNYLLQLHKILYSHSVKDVGGKFKNVQNYISAVDGEGKQFTLFTPPAPYEAPDMIAELCDEFNRAIAECEVDPLILIPVFIHDFLFNFQFFHNFFHFCQKKKAIYNFSSVDSLCYSLMDLVKLFEFPKFFCYSEVDVYL